MKRYINFLYILILLIIPFVAFSQPHTGPIGGGGGGTSITTPISKTNGGFGEDASALVATIPELNLLNGKTSVQSQPSEGAFVNGDKAKLDTIESNADVTDAGNVVPIITSTLGADNDTQAELNAKFDSKYESGDSASFASVTIPGTDSGGQYISLLEDTDNGTNYAGRAIYGDVTASYLVASPLAAPAVGQVETVTTASTSRTMSDGTSKNVASTSWRYPGYALTPVIGDPDSITPDTEDYYGGTLVFNAAGTYTLSAVAEGMNLTIINDDDQDALIDVNAADTIIAMIGGEPVDATFAQAEAYDFNSLAGICTAQYYAANTWLFICSAGGSEETP